LIRREECIDKEHTDDIRSNQEMKHLGETHRCADHDHDLVHELSRRLDSLWRCDQYIANANWRDDLRQFWEQFKAQEQRNVDRLKELICDEVKNNCF
jgi:hypothetical protein